MLAPEGANDNVLIVVRLNRYAAPRRRRSE